jgi:hypothetical protein
MQDSSLPWHTAGSIAVGPPDALYALSQGDQLLGPPLLEQ